jgi:hypothetical protein
LQKPEVKHAPQASLKQNSEARFFEDF